MAKFLILGGAGFIGSNFAKYVLDKGHEVIIVDNFSTGNEENIQDFMDDDKVDIYAFNNKNTDGYDCYNRKHNISENDKPLFSTLYNIMKSSDYIIHLAASVGVSYVEDNAQSTILNNMEMEQMVFGFNEKLQKPIFFASTSEVYGEGLSTQSSFKETDSLLIKPPVETRWGYACSKLMGEFLLHSYTQPFVIGRFFNVTSRNQVSNYGMVLPSFVEQALEKKPLTVYNRGLATRCYCHVDDAVDAMYKLMTTQRCYRQIFNIGNPDEINVLQLANRVNSLTRNGNNIIFDDESRCSTDIMRRVPCIDKIKGYIDWKPLKNLDHIIVDMIIHKG